MSLRINTNVAALNSYNNLNANQAKLEGAFQQLSSGLRINKAADDAAGLSIAQGLTSQINGLTQAVSNANDGINVAQIADGALGTTQDILQRMRGLVTKAANEGTQDSKSIAAIRQEVQNLNTQLDNISGQTKFGQTNLLDGSYKFNFQVGANGGDTIALDLSGSSVNSKSIGGINLTSMTIAGGAGPAGGALGDVKDAGFSVDDSVTKVDNTKTLGKALQAIGLENGATVSISTNATTGVSTVSDAKGNQVGTITSQPDGTFAVVKDNGTDAAEQVGTIDAKYSTRAAGLEVTGDTYNATGGISVADDAALNGALAARLGLESGTDLGLKLESGDLFYAIKDNGDGTFDIQSSDQADLTGGTQTTIGKISLGADGVYTVTNGDNTEVAKVDSKYLVSNKNFTGPEATSYDDSAALSNALGMTGGTDLGFKHTTAADKLVVADAGDGTWTISNTTDGVVGQVTQNSDGSFTIAKSADGGSTFTDAATVNGSAAAGTPATPAYSTAQATADLGAIDTAIGAISNARSQIGAVQNQLSYTVSNLQTAITNVTASRSNLTDADLAQQVTAMTQSQILTQAATSVLAQANSAPQAILKLLQ